MLIDSNIVIYSIQPGHEFLDHWLARDDTSFSVITQIEVLGFPQLTDSQRTRFEDLFQAATIVQMDEAVTQECIRLRRERRIKLADAIIAATALTHRLPLVTRNVEDFAGVPGLEIINPFDA
ncbi:type II toxin-antitoxin system VapC family toxin [bacterium]|nr:type II toxin-antitoxin system VapC family toxin [bacterium]